MKSGSPESEVGRRMVVPCKCWFAVLLVACCGALGAGTWAWGAQDPSLPAERASTLDDLADYLGFRFSSDGAQRALTEYLEAVSSARLEYSKAQVNSETFLRFAELEKEWIASEQEARDVLVGGLEVLVAKARKKGVAREWLHLEELVQRTRGGEAVPAERFLVMNKPRGASGRFRGHYYQLFRGREDMLVAHLAARRCEDLGGYLACVETMEELVFLSGLLEAEGAPNLNSGYWVGATDEETDGVWKWINGSPIESKMWADGQPDNNPGHSGSTYVQFHRFPPDQEEQWFLRDEAAGYRSPYICEWGGGHTLGWDAGHPGIPELVEEYWARVSKAKRARAKGVGDLEKKHSRHRKRYQTGVAKANKDAIKAMEAQLKTLARREGARDEAEALIDAVEELKTGGHFTLKPLGASDVPDGATAYDGSYFKVIEDGLSWHVARARCRDRGGRLAVATTSSRMEKLLALVRDQRERVWIGATDEVQEGEWLWVTGAAVSGTLIQRFALADGLTARKTLRNYGGVSHSLCIREGGLLSQVGDIRSSYICEWPWYW